jgi:DNA-binding NtrC family response regulator
LPSERRSAKGVAMTEGTTRVRREPGVARYAKIRVTVVRGCDAGLEIETAGATVRIGTASDNELALSDDSVSRRHCELEPLPEGVRVHDAGSTNGVLVAGLRVRDATVSGDFELVLGDTAVAVRWPGETVEREQAAAECFGDVLGRSPRMRELFAQLERIAATDYTLLVEGETGTGKDLVAESLHRASAREAGPFVVLDCGAVAQGLVESELFGHERGAFTGAVDARAGVFEQATGGTLFVDEIGEMPLELQPKLLRALEKRQFRRVGGARTLAFDARLIAATNRNLRAEVRRGRFREDLYYRLAAAHVQVPPLRDRLEDLELLVDHFLGLEGAPLRACELPDDVWRMFRAYRWPGNVRELRNAVQRLVISPDRPELSMLTRQPDALAAQSRPLPLRVARRQASDDFEKRYLERVLAHAGGSVTRAAAVAEVSRQMLQKLLKKHGLRGAQGDA